MSNKFNGHLEFDGLRLTAVDENGKVVESWRGISGNLGRQGPSYQNISDTGPIPEGNWKINADKVTYQDDMSLWNQFNHPESSWGEAFVKIIPQNELNTFERSGFYIHGGNAPASAGCIDLYNDNNKFFEWLEDKDGLIDLKVDYKANSQFLEDVPHPLLNDKDTSTVKSMIRSDKFFQEKIGMHFIMDANGNFAERLQYKDLGADADRVQNSLEAFFERQNQLTEQQIQEQEERIEQRNDIDQNQYQQRDDIIQEYGDDGDSGGDSGGDGGGD